MPDRDASRPEVHDLDQLPGELVQRYRRDVMSVYARHDLGEGDVLVVEALAQGSVTPTVLARTLGWVTPHVTFVLNRLESRDLIRRVRNPNDARSVGVMLTASGRELIEGVRVKRQERLDRILTDFTANEQGRLRTFLSKLTNATPAVDGSVGEV